MVERLISMMGASAACGWARLCPLFCPHAHILGLGLVGLAAKGLRVGRQHAAWRAISKAHILKARQRDEQGVELGDGRQAAGRGRQARVAAGLRVEGREV